jgi:hypothetical protein
LHSIFAVLSRYGHQSVTVFHMRYVRIRVRTGPDGDLENLNRYEREQTRKRRAEGDRFSRAALGIFGIAATWLEREGIAFFVS